MTALCSDDPAGESHAAEVTVVGIGDFDRRVAEHRIVDPRSNALDLVLCVDLPDVSVFPIKRERDLGAAGRRLRGRVVGNSRLDEPVRCRPDLHRPLLDGLHLRLRCGRGVGRGARGSGHVPRVGAADDLDRVLLARRGPGPTRLDDLDARHLHARGGRFVVDARREIADIERRPRQRGTRRLTELEPPAGPRILDRSHLGCTEGFGGRLERAGFLGGTRPERCGSRKGERQNSECAHGHRSPFTTGR